VLDEKQIGQGMLDDAAEDLPKVAARHGARIIGRPRFEFQPSWRVPGSGNVTRMVLVAHAPAEPAERPFLRAVS
jgi:hypothetical protein